MSDATISQAILTFILIVIFLGFLVWGLKTKQFKNVEEAKYRMLRDDQEKQQTEQANENEVKDE